MEQKKIIRCLIASPSDTTAERDICEKVFSELNNGIGIPYGFELKSLRWENDVHPGVGADGQDVINHQIDGKYDLFIGIMYTRFGSPTNRAESGTVEEFDMAYATAKRLQNMEIMFYFNDQPTNLSKLDLEQYKKVRDFRDNVVSQKCMYWLYNGPRDFEEQLRKHLNQYFNDVYSSVDRSTAESLTRVQFILEERLNRALSLFSGQPRIWVDPIISTKGEISINPDDNDESTVDIKEIVAHPQSIIISAPPQFGLTCLSHYLVLEAWKNGSHWLYINANKLKAHNVAQYLNNDFAELGLSSNTTIDAVILDEWSPCDNGAIKKLKAVCDTFQSTPVLLMRTIDDTKFLKGNQEDVKLDREFCLYTLLPMTRNQVRYVVTEYNHVAKITDDDALLEKVVSDITTLNIHRTPQNCFTLLKVDEKKFDNNPVNQCQMLEDVLYVLFEFTDLPRFSTKPDVKDCQFVMGCFCEMLIRENRSTFTYDEFITKTRNYCSTNLIDLDVKALFDVLYQNNILFDYDSCTSFKSSFWLLYFAARRMHTNTKFAEYIFQSKKYLDYPEIIEFYTGIDRNRADALTVLLQDLKATCDTVFTRISIPDTFNPYRFAKWNPKPEQIERMQQEVSDTVMNSGLPVAIKDKFQDEGYNQLSPFNQNIVIHEFFEEYYVYNLMQEIKSSSRALRNSDYADASIKKELLQEILRGWLQVAKVLFALIPVLATKGRAEYGGAGFLLSDYFGETKEERARNILFVILTNVVGFFRDDIYASKVAPLLFDAFEHQTNPLVKQQLALLLIICHPPKWYTIIDKYIVDLQKDAFFLFEILNEMRAQYRFGFLDEADLRIYANLIKKCLAKNNFGVKNPSLGQINKITSNILPQRDQEQDLDKRQEKD